MKVASVYAVYNMVFSSVSVMINVFRNSTGFVLGQSYHEDKNKFSRIYNHKRISAIKFQELWSSMRDCDKLLAAYISDEKVSKLGMRWMANEQIEKIREWEDKKKAGSLLSNSYEDAMQFFIAEGFVYESGWTEYNSPKEYTLYKSLKEFLWRKIDNYYAEIREIMNCNFFVSEGGRFSC